MIGLKDLKNEYNYSETHLRTILCRAEFNKFRISSGRYYLFKNSKEFHSELKKILEIKKNGYSNWRYKTALLMFILLNCQVVWCQQYEPVIIYSTSGEPQTILKGHIKYDNYGVPKSYIQTKTSMSSLRKK